MSQLHSSETFTIERLTQMAKAQKQDQDKYLNDIEIHKMNREKYYKLATNVGFLDSDDEKESKFKNLIQGKLQIRQEQLELEQKRQQDEEQQRLKNNSDYVCKVLILLACYFAGSIELGFVFFKSQHTPTGERIPKSTSFYLVGVGCQLLIAIIALVIFFWGIEDKQSTKSDLKQKCKTN